MIVFPNCKINLGLHILGKRSDGYHDLETVFYPLRLTDALEITTLHSQERSSSFPFTLSGTDVKGHPTSNLCVRAYKLLKKDFPDLPKVKMHLHKVIPSGAGLGGGSADAAFTLQLLNKMFHLGLSKEKLMDYASELGSDCPFFLINKPCHATGRGEVLEELELDISAYTIVVINPGIHIDTGLAFLNLTPAIPDHSIKEIIQRPLVRWKDELKNDFEKIIFPKYPEIVEIKDYLYSAGAEYASMSGSGSTVFGIFKPKEDLQLSFPPHYFVRQLPGQLQ
ncbi:MAG TPA: 4-(cytidine 5'-diphospho)-2-C-methyl-D-erythritol kinase [Chitinophagaceae bacterium]|nr:4-(cytidine 5'-diphospho)-2-C-methyl-D-erythritol kinase [Chitinophagaceae bacterium]